MPWKSSDHKQRLDFVSSATQPCVNFRKLCHAFSISAPTGYKWLARYRALGSDGLVELSRQPRHIPGKFRSLWRKEVISIRYKHPTWGVRKLHVHLKALHPKARKLPSQRTMGRWLKAADLSAPRRPTTRPGPQVERPLLTAASHANDVWTVDFKGWFRTGDGHRCDPLTVRDLASRCLLCATILANQSDTSVRRTMTGLFKQCGLPYVIRVDNGAPFAGKGALNLSRLSVWWTRLGIRVEFTRRGKPQDNGAHEQMHRVLKAETASPAAENLRAQQRRLDRWRNQYNLIRPHEAINYCFPADLYNPSSRCFHIPTPLSYPDAWKTRTVRSTGSIRFGGSLRFVGRAFVRQRIGIEPEALSESRLIAHVWNVYLGDLLIGQFHQSDANGNMRPVKFLNPYEAKLITQQNHLNV